MTIPSDVSEFGFALIDEALAPASLLPAIDALSTEDSSRRRAGRRNVAEEIPALRELACSPRLHAIAEEVLGPDVFAVRALLFDKTPGANWAVGWHQDVAIAVRQKIEVAGYSGWSIKAGVLHVHPPADILERMVTLRLHLDHCGENNGPLQVIPGSHRHGRLNEETIADLFASHAPKICSLAAGGVLVMRPLLLHASSPASPPSHRRVLHLEFAAQSLPHGLEWHQRLQAMECA